MRIKHSEYNIDGGNVEIIYSNGDKISIDISAVEDELGLERWEQSEFDRLIYDTPLEFAELLLSGKLVNYLKADTAERMAWKQNLRCYFNRHYDSSTAHELAGEFTMRIE